MTSPVQARFPFMPPPPPLPETLTTRGFHSVGAGRLCMAIVRDKDKPDVDRWTKVMTGHPIRLFEQWNGQSHFVGMADVRSWTTCVFRDLPARRLQRLNTGECTYTELLEDMRARYGSDFSEEEEVVLLTYKRRPANHAVAA